jgi:salicylate biosynthesis isochorismate synthase/menaquinone-specific isochorismate synthase
MASITREARNALERDRSRFRGLEPRLQEALRRARASGRPVAASHSAALEHAVDPLSVIAASRRPDEPWFHLGQADRRDAALATIGVAHEITPRGPERFKAAAARWRELVARAVADPPEGPPGSGLALVGGFAFAPDGAGSPKWQGFAATSLILPELSLARRDGETWLTMNAMVDPDDTIEDVVARLEARLQELRDAPPPLLDPDPVGRFHVSSPMPPSHYEEAVARAVQRIRAGELDKVVLAREVEVRAPSAHDPAAILSVLREGFPSCFVYAVGRGDATFLGASPELLVRREGQRATTVALAGSIGRSADPAVDDHLGERLLGSDKDRQENSIVAHRIAQALSPHSVWVTVAPEPAVVRVANIQHLAAPIRAQLARPMSALELAGVLHPTPAVGGEPWSVAEPLIPALEGLDRGWYAGPVGWCDLTDDGEFCVALRCALVRGPTATCYAGCGIVADSDPAAELAETEVKLQALLPVLAG